jgi:hypothetical protein
MMKHVTIKDIARSLCISVSTVSRALTDDKNIRKETREMVIEEAKRLGYKRNPVAMNLKMGRTNTIGVIVPEMHTPYASQVINGIQDVLYKKNQKVMIAESDEKPERELENLKMMEQFMVAINTRDRLCLYTGYPEKGAGRNLLTILHQNLMVLVVGYHFAKLHIHTHACEEIVCFLGRVL